MVPRIVGGVFRWELNIPTPADNVRIGALDRGKKGTHSRSSMNTVSSPMTTPAATSGGGVGGEGGGGGGGSAFLLPFDFELAGGGVGEGVSETSGEGVRAFLFPCAFDLELRVLVNRLR